MQSSLKPPAVVCKIVASIEAMAAAWALIGMDIYELHATEPPRDAQDWGTPAYYHRLYSSIAIVSLLAILVLIPNRWLTSSRLVFVPSLIIALLPLSFSLFLIFTTLDCFVIEPFETTIDSAIMILLSVPWPLSLIFSRMRFQRGTEFTYA
jgi:hypothetical protein